MSEEVIRHHLESFEKRDVDAIVQNYAEDAVMFVPGRLIEGRDAIKVFYGHFTTNVVPAGSEIEVLENIVHDEIAYLSWTAETEHIKITFATDTFVFDNNDKIKAHTIGFVITDNS